MVVSFYMSKGLGEEGVKYAFDVSEGTIMYMPHPTVFQSNVSYVIEIMEPWNVEYETLFMKPQNGIGGFYFSYTIY